MYVLIVTYSFDPQVIAHSFENHDDAVRALREDFESEKRIDIEENEWDTTATINEDGGYAKIVNHFEKGDDITEFRVAEITPWMPPVG